MSIFSVGLFSKVPMSDVQVQFVPRGCLDLTSHKKRSKGEHSNRSELVGVKNCISEEKGMLACSQDAGLLRRRIIMFQLEKKPKQAFSRETQQIDSRLVVIRSKNDAIRKAEKERQKPLR